MSSRVGLLLGSALPPERIHSLAREAEDAGFGELWLSEDMFFTGGIAGANIALANTSDIKVGLGIVSAVVRHPALLAMEVTTTARAFPGRFIPGIGLGVPAWIRQIGLYPESPLSTIRSCVNSLRDLANGKELTSSKDFFFDRVRLTHPLSSPLSIRLGVSGPKMLQLSGEIADGTILSVGSGLEYLGWAKIQIKAGMDQVGRNVPHAITQFTICAIDNDRTIARGEARKTLAFYLNAGGGNALTEAAGIGDELKKMLSTGLGAQGLVSEMPESWVENLTVSGTPDDVVQKIWQLTDGGADSVVLFPTSKDGADQIIGLLGNKSDLLPFS
ncbi:MAG: LLM class flavin-dependent oxidoreductase [Acidimicrobiaceae bacterium]|nr:LLM class flavin-dependent oxidoreductase [Acidimicrobiaceae bacterium]